MNITTKVAIKFESIDDLQLLYTIMQMADSHARTLIDEGGTSIRFVFTKPIELNKLRDRLSEASETVERLLPHLGNLTLAPYNDKITH